MQIVSMNIVNDLGKTFIVAYKGKIPEATNRQISFWMIRADYKVTEKNIYLISANPTELAEADYKCIKSIQIPLYENNKDKFSFANIGPETLEYKTRYFLNALTGKLSVRQLK